MIENFSDFLSIAIVGNMVLYGLYLGFRYLNKQRHRYEIRREIKYYRNIK